MSYKGEYKQQLFALLFIFTKLHTDLVSFVNNKINFEKYDKHNILRNIVKDKMMMYRLGEHENMYLCENWCIVPIIRANIKREHEHELKLKRERKEKQNKYIKIGICIGIMMLFNSG